MNAMSLNELRKLDDERLLQYFMRYSGYRPDSPHKDTRYSIRLGSKSLFAEDTAVLRETFFSEVRQMKRSEVVNACTGALVEMYNKLSDRPLHQYKIDEI